MMHLKVFDLENCCEHEVHMQHKFRSFQRTQWKTSVPKPSHGSLLTHTMVCLGAGTQSLLFPMSLLGFDNYIVVKIHFCVLTYILLL